MKQLQNAVQRLATHLRLYQFHLDLQIANPALGNIHRSPRQIMLYPVKTWRKTVWKWLTKFKRLSIPLFWLKYCQIYKGNLGNDYVPHNKFMPEALTRIDTKQTDVKNIFPDSIVSNNATCSIKPTSTPTKHVPNTDIYNIKYTITLTHYRLADSRLSQFDIIHVHQQKEKSVNGVRKS